MRAENFKNFISILTIVNYRLAVCFTPFNYGWKNIEIMQRSNDEYIQKIN